MALRTFIAPHMPTTTQYFLQSEPGTPAPGMLAIRFVKQSPSRDLTATRISIERFYQFIYYGKTNIDVIDTADILRRALTDRIKIKAGADYLTVGAFAVLPPTKAENGTDAVVCTFTVDTTEGRTLPEAPKMGDIGIIMKPEEPNKPPREEVEVVVPCSINEGGIT